MSPQDGWVAWDQDALTLLVFSQGQWTEATAAQVAQLDKLGINTAADLTNRLAVSSDATLLTHAATGGHQLKINKDQPGDTGSLLFQTSWSGRAEMGTTGSDNFEIKVSPDGSTFHQALTVDRATGAVTLPNTILSQAEFGTSPIVTVDYTNSKTGNMVCNGNGSLGNSYNMPSALSYDASDTPGLPGGFLFTGYHGSDLTTSEFIAVDAHKTYRLESYIKQANGDRHAQVMGIMAFDADFQQITSASHMRYTSGGVDSLTTLSAPLAPGDTTVSVTNASGWNTTDSSSDKCGLIFLPIAPKAAIPKNFTAGTLKLACSLQHRWIKLPMKLHCLRLWHRPMETPMIPMVFGQRAQLWPIRTAVGILSLLFWIRLFYQLRGIGITPATISVGWTLLAVMR